MHPANDDDRGYGLNKILRDYLPEDLISIN